jgi:hypothetical protein
MPFSEIFTLAVMGSVSAALIFASGLILGSRPPQRSAHQRFAAAIAAIGATDTILTIATATAGVHLLAPLWMTVAQATLFGTVCGGAALLYPETPTLAQAQVQVQA